MLQVCECCGRSDKACVKCEEVGSANQMEVLVSFEALGGETKDPIVAMTIDLEDEIPPETIDPDQAAYTRLAVLATMNPEEMTAHQRREVGRRG